jgi:hypothetical protein
VANSSLTCRFQKPGKRLLPEHCRAVPDSAQGDFVERLSSQRSVDGASSKATGLDQKLTVELS